MLCSQGGEKLTAGLVGPAVKDDVSNSGGAGGSRTHDLYDANVSL